VTIDNVWDVFFPDTVYICKMYILCGHIRVCCGYDVIVIYDVTEH